MKDLNFNQTEIENVIIHGIGNRAKDEELFFSYNELNIDQAQMSVLLSYYLNNFKNEEFFEFIGNEFMGNKEGVETNIVYNLIKNINEDPENLISYSQKIANQLFLTTTHPKIPNGELSIVRFSNIMYKDEILSGIGIFKSETTEPYIKTIRNDTNINIERQEGMGLKKLDRACLILNTDKNNGYRILNVDKTKGDINPHWTHDFLMIKRKQESFSFTESFISMVSSFAQEILIDENEVSLENNIKFLQNSKSYLETSEKFDIEEYFSIVINNTEMEKTFIEYKKDFSESYNIDIIFDFTISKDAIKENKKMFDTVIKLDDSFKIQVTGDPSNIEEGTDKDKDMKYIKIYYKEKL